MQGTGGSIHRAAIGRPGLACRLGGRFARCDERYRKTAPAQALGDHIAVAAVVARPAEHRRRPGLPLRARSIAPPLRPRVASVPIRKSPQCRRSARQRASVPPKEPPRSRSSVPQGSGSGRHRRRSRSIRRRPGPARRYPRRRAVAGRPDRRGRSGGTRRRGAARPAPPPRARPDIRSRSLRPRRARSRSASRPRAPAPPPENRRPAARR